jgi:hypothetical protein
MNPSGLMTKNKKNENLISDETEISSMTITDIKDSFPDCTWTAWGSWAYGKGWPWNP